MSHNELQMKNYDIKHIAYHALVGLYFIWLPIFCILLGMSLNASFKSADLQFDRIFLVWILLNFIMGSALFFVIRLFEYKDMLTKIVTYTYISMAIVGIAAIALMLCRM